MPLTAYHCPNPKIIYHLCILYQSLVWSEWWETKTSGSRKKHSRKRLDLVFSVTVVLCFASALRKATLVDFYCVFRQTVPDSSCAQWLVCCHHVTSLLVWPSECFMPLSISDMVALQCTLLNREYPWFPPPHHHKEQTTIDILIIFLGLWTPLCLLLVVFESSYS